MRLLEVVTYYLRKNPKRNIILPKGDIVKAKEAYTKALACSEQHDVWDRSGSGTERLGLARQGCIGKEV